MSSGIADVLRKARARIAKPETWTKGYAALTAEQEPTDPDSPKAVCWCARGALEAEGCCVLVAGENEAEDGNGMDLTAWGLAAPWIGDFLLTIARSRAGAALAEYERLTGGKAKPAPTTAPARPRRGPPPPRASEPRREAKPGEPRAGARRMLVVLVQFHARGGLTRAQLGTLAGVTATSGTFTTYLSDLRRSGLVEERDGKLQATARGIQRVGPDAPTLMTATDLRALWFARLRAGERRMLEAVIASPKGLTRAELGAAAEISSGSGTFQTYLSKLRSAGLVAYDGPVIRKGPAWEVLEEQGGRS